ncbi:hypothetical protein Tco_1331099 [Tanacetum coccineum]
MITRYGVSTSIGYGVSTSIGYGVSNFLSNTTYSFKKINNAVAPPPIGLFAPPTIDLSNSGLEEFKQPEFEGYGVKVKKNVNENSSNEIKKTSGALIIKDWVSDCDEDETMEKVSKLANVKKPQQAGQPRNSGLVPISTARQSSSRVALSVSTPRPIKSVAPKPFVNVAKSRQNVFQKSHSPSRRPLYQQAALKNRNLNNKVNTVKVNSVNTAKAKGVTSAVRGQGINVVKPTSCWVWRPKSNVIDHISKNSGSYIYKKRSMIEYLLWSLLGQDTKVPQSDGPSKRLVMGLSIRSWVTEWKGLPLLLLALKQSRTVVT